MVFDPYSHQVRTYGIWYNYCADEWSDGEASTICEVLGFSNMRDWSMGEALVGAHLDTTPQTSAVRCSTLYLNCESQLVHQE